MERAQSHWTKHMSILNKTDTQPLNWPTAWSHHYCCCKESTGHGAAHRLQAQWLCQVSQQVASTEDREMCGALSNKMTLGNSRIPKTTLNDCLVFMVLQKPEIFVCLFCFSRLGFS